MKKISRKNNESNFQSFAFLCQGFKLPVSEFQDSQIMVYKIRKR